MTIFRRYGTTYQSVDVNFDALALNEIGFRRNREESVPLEVFDGAFQKIQSHELIAEAEGEVQSQTEQLLLERLKVQVDQLSADLGESDVLVVENEQGHDWPKTKQKTSNVIVEGENRLRFRYSIDPPLRISVLRRPG
jgi:hypothetical protein